MLCVAMYRHLARSRRREQGFVCRRSPNVLIYGPSGCGKTEIARVLARIAGLPFYIVDSTQLVPTGAVGGKSPEKILMEFVKAVGVEYPKEIEKGVIFLDEIDKLVPRNGDRQHANWIYETQDTLLKFLEGNEYCLNLNEIDNEFVIDTSGILFIAAGAFVGLDKIVKERIDRSRRSSVGFITSDNLPAVSSLPEPRVEDFVEFGLMPELMGRLPHISHVEPLTVDDMTNIVLNSKNSPLAQINDDLAVQQNLLTIAPEAARIIAERALEDGIGARGLSAQLEKELEGLLYEVLGSVEKTEFRITADAASKKLKITQQPLSDEGRGQLRNDEERRKAAFCKRPQKNKDDSFEMLLPGGIMCAEAAYQKALQEQFEMMFQGGATEDSEVEFE
ncbi:MAG: AAA family ATPase [Pyramidobacter sp.]|nr:AAA family ATPase [Pyramidobacter sp.]